MNATCTCKTVLPLAGFPDWDRVELEAIAPPAGGPPDGLLELTFAIKRPHAYGLGLYYSVDVNILAGPRPSQGVS